MILIFLSNVIFSLYLLSASYVTKVVEPLYFNAASLVIAGIIFSLFSCLKKYPTPNKKTLLMLAITLNALPYYLQLESFKFATVKIVALITSLTPFASGILERILRNYKFTKVQWVSMVFVFIATLFSSYFSTPADNYLTTNLPENSTSLFPFQGELYAFISVMLFAFSWIKVKELVDKSYSPVTIFGFTMLIGGLICYVFGFIFDNENFTSSLNYTTLASAFVLTVFGNGLYRLVNAYLLKKYSATLIAMTKSTAPILIALIQWIFLGKELDLYFILASFIIVFALYVFIKEKDKQKILNK